jgi:peptidoglycan/xylan/chitin deacetylase (PgdA/CDA1 family)
VDASRIRSESNLFLDLGELPRLAEFGCVVGNHTRSHVACHTIPNDEVAAAELVEHQRDLEHWTRSTVKAFSYPYGSRRDATPLVERVLAESNHQASFLVESRPNRSNQRRRPWNRVSLHHQSTARLTAELELLPQLRALRHFLSGAAVNVRLPV